MTRRAFSPVLAATLARVALAQSQPPLPVDRGIDDVDPLRTSIRVPLERDLRVPSGWDAVYAVRYRDASGQVREGFARANGAVVAVFPWSVYVPVRGGTVAQVPPGTVFHLGPLPSVEEPPPPESSVPRPQTSAQPPTPARPETARPSLDARPGPTAIPAPEAVPGIWTDETYRRGRVSALIRRAAAGRE